MTRLIHPWRGDGAQYEDEIERQGALDKTRSAFTGSWLRVGHGIREANAAAAAAADGFLTVCDLISEGDERMMSWRMGGNAFSTHTDTTNSDLTYLFACVFT